MEEAKQTALLLGLCFHGLETGYIALFMLDRKTGGATAMQMSIDDLEGVARTALDYMHLDVYFSPAILGHPLEGNRRGKKEDFPGSQVCWVDLDLPPNGTGDVFEIARQLEEWKLPPTLMIHSGGGIHAYWKLDHFYPAKEVEAANLGLERELGGDRCHSIDHVLRVPGTLNYKYDPPAEVRVILYKKRTYKLEELPRAERETLEGDAGDLKAEALPEDFLATISDELRERILHGSKEDRSANDYHVVKTLLSLGYTQGQCLSVLETEDWAVGDKTKQRGRQYALRTVAAAVRKEEPKRTLSDLVEDLHWVPTARGEGVKRVKEIDPDRKFTGPIIRWFRNEGLEFLRDPGPDDGYIFWEGRVIRADKDFRGLKDFLYEQARITEMTWDSRKIREALSHEARISGRDVELRPWITFDTQTCTGYILPDPRSGYMLTVSPAGVRQTHNGEGGYLLKPSLLAKKLSINPTADKVAGLRLIRERLLDQLACAVPARSLMTCYVMAVILAAFAADDLLPILHVTGPAGGGKSWALKLLTCWFYGQPMLLQPTQASSQAISDNDTLICLDDYESLDPEWERRLLTGATGQLRTKMSAFGEHLIIQRSSACFALTSLNPLSSGTLRRRALVVDVDATVHGSETFNAATAVERLTEVRDSTWTAYLTFLAEDVLPAMAKGSARDNIAAAQDLMTGPNKGLATYLTLMWLIGSAAEKYSPGFLGVDDTSLIGVLQQWCGLLQLQSEAEFFEREPLVQYVETVLTDLQQHSGDIVIGDAVFGAGRPQGFVVRPITEAGRIVGFEGPSGDLHATFGAMARSHGLRYEFRNAHHVGKLFRMKLELLGAAGFTAEPRAFGSLRGWRVVSKEDRSNV